jgi:hypothetical protein
VGRDSQRTWDVELWSPDGSLVVLLGRRAAAAPARRSPRPPSASKVAHSKPEPRIVPFDTSSPNTFAGFGYGSDGYMMWNEGGGYYVAAPGESWAAVVPWYAVVAATATLPFVLLWRRLGQRLRISVGGCPACGYDLRATPERCPECGAMVEE